MFLFDGIIDTKCTDSGMMVKMAVSEINERRSKFMILESKELRSFETKTIMICATMNTAIGDVSQD